MSQTGSPLQDEKQKTHSVSPLTFLPASRCSTPGIYSLDGQPRHLSALPPPPSRPRSASPLGMAVHSFYDPNRGHQERSSKVKPATIPVADEQNHAEGPLKALLRDDNAQAQALDPVPSLGDLAQLIRKERYQLQHCKHLQRQLHQVQTVAARTSRLVHTASSIQRTLAECIKSEDKHSFVNLFNALHDSLDFSDTTNGLDDDRWAGSCGGIDYPDSFLDVLPSDCRKSILDFVFKVRTDGNFLADRLAALTHRELVSLLPEKGQPRSTESIFGSSPRTSSRTSRHLGFVADGQTELLSSFEYACGLETLIFAARGVSVPDLAGDPVATDVWSTVCARLISEQKPGCERFVPAVINLWAVSSPWLGKERLSIWISDIIRRGQFLQEQPSKQTFRLRTQGLADSDADHEARLGQFFGTSVTSLFTMLGEQAGSDVIPEGARKLCQAIYRKLQPWPHQQQVFPNFVLTRWLFSSFLPDAITLPEIHGLMTDEFFSGTTRRQVLREIAGRASKVVFDVVYSWKYGNTTSPEATELVRLVAGLFRDEMAGLPTDMSYAMPGEDTQFVPLSFPDIGTLVSALCPKQKPASILSDFDPSTGGVQSSASSVSGLSLFRNSGSVDLGYRTQSPWSQDLTQSIILEAGDPASSENCPSYARVDSVVQVDWDSEPLREAFAALEDYMSDTSSSVDGTWCILTKRSDQDELFTLKDAIFQIPGFGPSCGRTFHDSSSEHFSRQKVRSAIEESLLNDDVTGNREAPTGTSDLAHLHNIELRLRAAFENRVEESKRALDFATAHASFRKLRNFDTFVKGKTGLQALHHALLDLKSDKEEYLRRSQHIAEQCDVWISRVKPVLNSCAVELQRRADATSRLRDKMWYVAEVRTSAAYDEARLIASALKTMGKPKKPARTRLAPPLRHWSASRMSSSAPQVKTEAQTLDLLSAPPEYGGPNKLSDDQSKALSLWMERNAVENLCMGEERLHRLCMEIRKAVDAITVESSPLLSSTLFARDKTSNASQSRASTSNPLWPLQTTSGRLDLLTLQTNVPSSIDSLSSASSNPLSARSSRDYLEARSPALTNKSSIPFWSPVVTEARSPSSATSIGSSQTHAATGQRGRLQYGLLKNPDQNAIENLRQRTTALLLSELGNVVFGEGSETDRAFWTGLGGYLTEKHLLALYRKFPMASPEKQYDEDFDFDFETSFKMLMTRFQATSNPFVKLKRLLEIDSLLAPYMTMMMQNDDVVSPRTESQLNTHSLRKLKRQGSSQASIKVEGFRRLLCNSSMRPATIFRDLQYIAALVPSTTLESTPEGKAFWNMAVAISSLKQEVRQFMVETADGIILYHSNNRGHGRAASTAQQERDSATFSVPSRTPSAEDIKRYNMADAAYLLQITAKEGVPAAQRELATLYLTHPELMDHIIAPFSRPQDVFKEELESKWRKNQDPNRCDPATMCVAHHWMSLSNKAGDGLAKEILKQREEMEKLPGGITSVG